MARMDRPVPIVASYCSGAPKGREVKRDNALSKVGGSTRISSNGHLLGSRMVTANYRTNLPSGAK